MKSASDDLSLRLEAACAIAREAGRLILERRGEGAGTAFSMKGHQDFLTVVDGLSTLKPGSLGALNLRVDQVVLDKAPTIPSGIFR